MNLIRKVVNSIRNGPKNLRTLRPYVEWKLDLAAGDDRYLAHFNEWYLKIGIRDSN